MIPSDFLFKFLDSLEVSLFKEFVKDVGIDKPWVYQVDQCKTTKEIKTLLLNFLKKEYDIETDYFYSLFNSEGVRNLLIDSLKEEGNKKTKAVALVVPKWGENILN